VVVLPVIQEWSTYPFGPIHERVGAFCRERGIATLDLLDAFRASERPWTALRVGAHDEHPNADGHRLIAGEIVRAIEEWGLLDGCRGGAQAGADARDGSAQD
jgi:hypothetical protein